MGWWGGGLEGGGGRGGRGGFKVSLDNGQKVGISPYPSAESSSGFNEGFGGQIGGVGVGGGGGNKKRE